MKRFKSATLLVACVLALALAGCGGGGTETPAPPTFAGSWQGQISGDRTGAMAAEIEPDGAVRMWVRLTGLGAFEGTGRVDHRTGHVTGVLGERGTFTGRLRLEGGTLKGNATFPDDWRVTFALTRQ